MPNALLQVTPKFSHITSALHIQTFLLYANITALALGTISYSGMKKFLQSPFDIHGVIRNDSYSNTRRGYTYHLNRASDVSILHSKLEVTAINVVIAP